MVPFNTALQKPTSRNSSVKNVRATTIATVGSKASSPSLVGSKIRTVSTSRTTNPRRFSASLSILASPQDAVLLSIGSTMMSGSFFTSSSNSGVIHTINSVLHRLTSTLSAVNCSVVSFTSSP